MRRDLGDFQTPPALVAAVLDLLGPVGARWARVLEPGCGRGHFLSAVLERGSRPREIRGVEIQEDHCAAARASCGPNAEILRASLFDLDLRRDLGWEGSGPLLVVGNPPWVTNAELGVLGSGNLPAKSNVKRLRGLDARTGSANFDTAEAVWLKLLAELAGEDLTIALLCKTAVARAVLQHAHDLGLPVAEASLHKIDAAHWFRAAVDACLFRVTLGLNDCCARVPVYSELGAAEPESIMGFARGRLVADLEAYAPSAFADGECHLTWRQGLKHDAASVMELVVDGGGLRNKLGEVVDVEPEWVYPLLKGADLHRSTGPRRAVIVTQTRIGADTTRLEHEAPKLWSYLQTHAAVFARRKSSIYRGRSPFALFGVGPYSFAPDKVAVSGLHKVPRFRAVGPVEGRPVMFDDTCYFVPCESADHAAEVAALGNDPITLGLVRALSFPGAKRPITKALLQRIDFEAVRSRRHELATVGKNSAENVHGPPDFPLGVLGVLCDLCD